jgi:hypothetical protein
MQARHESRLERQGEMMNKIALLPIMTDFHTDDCNAFRARREAIRAAWIAQYPRYCTDCNGFGGHATGGSLYEPPTFDLCATCLDRYRCPRCGAAGANPDAWVNNEGPICKTCGWNSDDHCPLTPMCLCALSGGLPDLGELEDHPF